jgi:class 3 adenylate cyclase
VARWLAGQGFRRLSILEGGLAAWRNAGFAVETLQGETSVEEDEQGTTHSMVARPESFLPSLATRYLSDGGLPTRRRLTTLFVDIAGSTRLLEQHPAETVLGLVQRFMRLVTDVALAYCGDVKDFEGDGALLYFESTAEAAQAALAIRDTIASGACGMVCPVSARMSLTVGHVVVGLVGTAMRQSIALVGTSVHVGARLLKHIPPGGIIASGEFVESLGAEGSDLAEKFRLREESFEVPGSDGITVTTYAIL